MRFILRWWTIETYHVFRYERNKLPFSCSISSCSPNPSYVLCETVCIRIRICTLSDLRVFIFIRNVNSDINEPPLLTHTMFRRHERQGKINIYPTLLSFIDDDNGNAWQKRINKTQTQTSYKIFIFWYLDATSRR